MNIIKLIPALLLLILVGSCSDSLSGDFKENQPPSTNLTVESINREGDFRLSSQIRISWFGKDPDGYVIGYEYAINDTSENAWTFTTKTDSIFILPITPGQSQDDVLFKVRAIDNDEARDPIGARLIYPIVNSTPTASLVKTQIPPDTLFSIASFGWNIGDPDGILNIDRTEIAINDTINGWQEIPFSVEEDGQIFISLEVDNSSIGLKDAQVFIGRGYSTGQINGQNIIIPNVEVGARNTFYVRTIDAAEAISPIDSVSWYIKEQKSKTLFLNDFAGLASAEASQFHLDALKATGVNPDVWIINDKEVEQEKVQISAAFPASTDPTLTRTLEKWDHIYWISNDLDRNITYAQEVTSRFFQNGGNAFISIPMKSINSSDAVFNFLPVDSIGIGQFALQNNSLLLPEQPELNDTLAVLSNSFVLLGVYPIKGVSGSKQLYSANFFRRSATGALRTYNGYKGVAVENEEGNLIYLSLNPRDMNGKSNFNDFIQSVVIDRLGFKQ